MKVLLSIKPEFVRKIFEGSKKFEFRKSLFQKKGVKHVIIYASFPVKRVVGEFEIIGVLSGNVDDIWNKTKEFSGISNEFYRSYFQGKRTANAIVIGNVTIFNNFKCLADYNIKQAPQSFCYIDD